MARRNETAISTGILDRLREGIVEGLRLAAREASGPIDSIGVDGWGVDYVRLDADLKPLARSILLSRHATEKVPGEFWKIFPAERLYALTGIQLLRFNTLYQLIADRQAGLPEGSCWLNLPEYILCSLGARPVSEFTLATHSNSPSATRRAWAPEIFQAAGLDARQGARACAPRFDHRQTKGELAELEEFHDTNLIAPATMTRAPPLRAFRTRVMTPRSLVPEHGPLWAPCWSAHASAKRRFGKMSATKAGLKALRGF